MCDLGITAAVVGIVGTVVGAVSEYVVPALSGGGAYYAGTQAATAQAEQISQQNQYAYDIAENANQAAIIDYGIIDDEEEQVSDQAALDKFERARQGLRERATARVAASESGIAGVSADRIITDSMFQEGYDSALYEYSARQTYKQLDNERLQVANTNQGRVNQANAAYINPTVADYMITSAGTNAGINTYNSLKSSLGAGASMVVDASKSISSWLKD